MAEALTLPSCKQCGKVLKGRIDKKFCDDSCRNNYNNAQNSDSTNLIRNINAILKKNRKILESFIAKSDKDMVKATKEKLIEAGFNFKHLTHTYKNKQGNLYIFCYEYGYLPLENDWMLLVHRKENEATKL
jgi:hypothetical protein